MKIIVQRRWPDAKCVIGEMSIDGRHECYTLEPPIKTDGSKPRAIPAGTYDVTIRWSPRFHRLMPHVENIPDFDGVEIHWGNFPQDTEGCTVVGGLYGVDFVGHSRTEFDTLYLKLWDAEKEGITITYLDVPLTCPDIDGELSV